MSTEKKEGSILLRELDPFILAGSLLTLSCLVMLISFSIFQSQDEPDWSKIWLIASSFVLCYVIFNSILSYSANNINRYWTRSFIGYVALILISGGVAYALSGIPIDEAGTYKWLYVVFTMCFLIFLVIVRLMRTILDLAQKQDKNLRNEL